MWHFVTMFSKSRLLQRRQKASIWGKGLIKWNCCLPKLHLSSISFDYIWTLKSRTRLYGFFFFSFPDYIANYVCHCYNVRRVIFKGILFVEEIAVYITLLLHNIVPIVMYIISMYIISMRMFFHQIGVMAEEKYVLMYPKFVI